MARRACPATRRGGRRGYESVITRTVTFSIAVTETERLDRFLADQLNLSRTQASRLLGEKQVRVDGGHTRASRCLERGAVVEVDFTERAPARTHTPYSLDLTFAYEDDHLAVVNKPPGLVVHPAPGHWDDTLVNALVAHGMRLGGPNQERLGIVHRLDRDTSGLMIIAKTDLAHRRLTRALATRKIRRTYAAMVWGHLKADSQVIDAPIGRNTTDRKRMSVRADGRPATTMAYVVARFRTTDLLRVELQTGRTHQIRVHLSHIGHPVVGDPAYGGGGPRRVSGIDRPAAERIARLAPRQALHAVALSFTHPESQEPLDLRSEWPADLRPALDEASDGADLLDRPNPLEYLGFHASYDRSSG